MAQTLPPQDPIPDRLNGLVALITGAAGNIGLECARRYLLEGAKVVLVDINADKLVQAKGALVESMQELPVHLNPEDRILAVPADVTSEEDVERYVDETVCKFGRLDVALLCAVMQVNCRSAFLGVKHCARAMKASGNGGSIILVSSIAGLRATPGLSAYSTSKFALRGLCITAAAELGKYNIRVNTAHPCGVNTPMFLASWPEEKMKSMLETVPLGRWAEVADVAALAGFLGSPDSRFMTGGALKVDGGIVMY